MDTFTRYATLLCLLSGLSGVLPASSFEQSVKQECLPISAPWDGYVSSLSESMGSPYYSFVNELNLQWKSFVIYGVFSGLNYYMSSPQVKPLAFKMPFVLGATGLIVQSGVSVISGFVLSEDTVTLNKVSLAVSALAHLVPSAVVTGDLAIHLMVSQPGCCTGLIKPVFLMAGALNVLRLVPAIAHSQGAVNMLKRNTVLRVVSELHAVGLELKFCSPVSTQNNLITFSSMQKRNETALLKQVHPEFNPCLNTTGFDSDEKEACKHSVKVTDLYSKSISHNGTAILKNNGTGMEWNLISEVDHLTYEQIESAIRYPQDSYLEASKYVEDYSKPKAVEQDKFQYFLTVSGRDRKYLVFGVQMNSEDDEYSLWGLVQFHLLAVGQITYYPHISMVAEVQNTTDYSDLSKVVKAFFRDADRRALLFEIKDPRVAEKAELTETSSSIEEETHAEL